MTDYYEGFALAIRCADFFEDYLQQRFPENGYFINLVWVAAGLPPGLEISMRYWHPLFEEILESWVRAPLSLYITCRGADMNNPLMEKFFVSRGENLDVDYLKQIKDELNRVIKDDLNKATG